MFKIVMFISYTFANGPAAHMPPEQIGPNFNTLGGCNMSIPAAKEWVRDRRDVMVRDMIRSGEPEAIEAARNMTGMVLEAHCVNNYQ